MRPRSAFAVLWTSAGTGRRSLSRRLWCLSSVLDQFDGLMVPGSGRFDDHWIKNVSTGQTAVLAGLIGSCVFCRRSCFPGLLLLLLLHFMWTQCNVQSIRVWLVRLGAITFLIVQRGAKMTFWTPTQKPNKINCTSIKVYTRNWKQTGISWYCEARSSSEDLQAQLLRINIDCRAKSAQMLAAAAVATTDQAYCSQYVVYRRESLHCCHVNQRTNDTCARPQLAKTMSKRTASRMRQRGRFSRVLLCR